MKRTKRKTKKRLQQITKWTDKPIDRKQRKINRKIGNNIFGAETKMTQMSEDIEDRTEEKTETETKIGTTFRSEECLAFSSIGSRKDTNHISRNRCQFLRPIYCALPIYHTLNLSHLSTKFNLSS